MTFYIPWPIDWINRYQVKGYNGQNVTIATKVGILYQVNQCIIIIPYLKNQTKNKLLDHIIIITCCQKYFLTTVLFFYSYYYPSFFQYTCYFYILSAQTILSTLCLAFATYESFYPLVLCVPAALFFHQVSICHLFLIHSQVSY